MAGLGLRFQPVTRPMRATAARRPAEPGQRKSLPCVNPKEVSTRLRRLLKEFGFGRTDQSQRRGKPSSRIGGTDCSAKPSGFSLPPELVAVRSIRATGEVGLIATTGEFRLRKPASPTLPQRHRENRIRPSQKGPQPRLFELNTCQLLRKAVFIPQQLLQCCRVRPGEKVSSRNLAI